ncbi:hypothetical protein MN0502_23370 [Arthrobacter sp. MN05-02]|nr:hypothetical protein MN0502_23370 [Arthrobacter sp. MN05-02]
MAPDRVAGTVGARSCRVAKDASEVEAVSVNGKGGPAGPPDPVGSTADVYFRSANRYEDLPDGPLDARGSPPECGPQLSAMSVRIWT